MLRGRRNAWDAFGDVIFALREVPFESALQKCFLIFFEVPFV